MATAASELPEPRQGAPVVSGAAAARQQRPSFRLLRLRRKLLPALFLLPVVVYAAAFFAYPLVNGFLVSFEQYGFAQLVSGSGPFVGLENYRQAISDPVTLAAARNTAIFTVLSVAFQVSIGLAIAVLLSRRFFLATLLRRLVLVPWMLPGVATGSIFAILFGAPNAFVNTLLLHLHLIHSSVQWLIEYTPAMAALVVTNIWLGLPFNIIVLYSGLQGLDAQVQEAAMTDGATHWQRFRFVTVPMLKPVLLIVIALGLIATVKTFDIVIVMTGGGPNNVTQLLSTWSYTQAFTNYNYGEGAAIGNILLVVSMIFAAGYLYHMRKE
jgi:multiple sugar transport system permease protein